MIIYLIQFSWEGFSNLSSGPQPTRLWCDNHWF